MCQGYSGSRTPTISNRIISRRKESSTLSAELLRSGLRPSGWDYWLTGRSKEVDWQCESEVLVRHSFGVRQRYLGRRSYSLQLFGTEGSGSDKGPTKT